MTFFGTDSILTLHIKKLGCYVFKEIHCKNLNILNSVELNFNINGVPSEGKTFKFSYEKENYEIRIRPATGFVNVVKDED